MSFWIQNMQINQNISNIEVIEHWHCTVKRTLRQISDSLTYRAGSLHLLLPYVTLCYHTLPYVTICYHMLPYVTILGE